MRLFVAIKIDANKRIEEILSQLSNLGKAVEEKNIHLTLKFLGEVSDESKIIKNLEEVRYNKFTIELRGADAFPSLRKGRILFIKAEPAGILEKLSTEIDNSTISIKRDHPFTPHITVLRSKILQDFSSIAENIGKDTILSQQVDHFSLYQSTLTSAGPIYKELKRFQLI